MPQARVYINPFDVNGNYTQFQDVTKYVRKLGEIGVDHDSNDYQLGIYRNSAFAFDVNNREGNFSDVDNTKSIFRFTRNDAIVRITYSLDPDGPICGFAICGECFLSDEVTVFEGLLVDDAAAGLAKDQKLAFSVNGFETLFDRIAVGAGSDQPFASLANGDTIAQTIYKILNQSVVTNLLTLDPANINPGTNAVLDDVSVFSGTTGSDAVNQMLLVSNSILYIRNRTIYVTDRSGTVDVKMNFYGQASRNGIENIYDIQNDKSGQARVYNYFTWDGSAVLEKDNASIRMFGVRLPASAQSGNGAAISFAGITNPSTQATILTGLLTEFKNIKREFDITVPLSYDTLNLNVKDRISVDYPIPYFPPATGVRLPICGIAICGVDRLPTGIWNILIDPSIGFKILAYKHNLDPLKYTTTLKLRRI